MGKGKYDEILLRNVDKSDLAELNDFHSIISIDGFAYASDTHIMLKTPKKNIKRRCYKVGSYLSDKITDNYKYTPEFGIIIKTTDLETALSKCPKTNVFRKQERCCTECDGCGDIQVEYYSSQTNETYEVIAPCPVCNGRGGTYELIDTGVLDYDYSKTLVDFGRALFAVGYVAELLQICKDLDCNELTWVKQDDNLSKGCFKIKDIDIVLMPCNVEMYQKPIIIKL